MSLDSRTTSTLFRFVKEASPDAPGGSAAPKASSARIPTFTVQPSTGGWWSSLKALCTPGKFSAVDASRSIFRYARARKQYFRGPTVAVSVIVHVVTVLLLIFLPRVILTDEPELMSAPARMEKIYYLPIPKKEIRAAGSPGAHAAGVKTQTASAPPAAAPENKFSAPSMAHPKLARQASKPVSPSDIILQNSQVQLADLTPVNIPKPQIQYNASTAKPVLNARQASAGAAPSISTTNAATGVMSSFSSSAPQPLSMGGASGPIATRRSAAGNGSGTVAAPEIGTGSTSSDANGIFSTVVDPGAPAGVGGVGVPGKGDGGFAVSSSDRVGRPEGLGGDSNRDGYGGKLIGEAAMSMVIAVPQSFTLRRNMLVVSAGPIGGGGLAVYKVLNCEKIYTIFLSMPGKNWTMQYCPEIEGPSSQVTQEAGTTVVHVGEGIVAPQPESEFDFRRLLLPPEKSHQTMILKGMLRADGSVGDVQVYQGIMPQMDEAARAAMGRWHFKPAMKDNKAIAVRILVGIPMDVPTVSR